MSLCKTPYNRYDRCPQCESKSICGEYHTYKQGQDNILNKVFKKIEDIRTIKFITIANTGNEKLDCAYEEISKTLDWLILELKDDE